VNSLGIVLLGTDATIEARAKRDKLPVMQGAYSPPPFEKTLFVMPKTTVPFDLLPAAWHFLDRWDAAVPLWRYGVLAEDVGTPSERKRTVAVVRDLRVLLYSHELLFVRNNEAGNALMTAFVDELQYGDARLAFLRAMYRVKPMVCVLPVTWLAEVAQRSEKIKRIGKSRQKNAVRNTGRQNAGRSLVSVEISLGRFVQCYAGDEEKVKAEYEKRKSRSRAERRRG